MAERFIEANELAESFKAGMITGRETFPIDYICEAIDESPTIDAVHVVRCCDCDQFDDGTCKRTGLRVEDNDFCSYGEKKEGERNGL